MRRSQSAFSSGGRADHHCIALPTEPVSVFRPGGGVFAEAMVVRLVLRSIRARRFRVVGAGQTQGSDQVPDDAVAGGTELGRHHGPDGAGRGMRVLEEIATRINVVAAVGFVVGAQ